MLFNLGIYRQNGVQITGTSAKNNNLYPVTAKQGTVKYTISNEYFLDNDYALTIAVFDGETKETLDYHSNRFQFRVRLNIKDWGSVSIPSKWELIS